jgi:hypothetical protein
MIESEVWKDVSGYESRYSVSNTGLVKSYDLPFPNQLTGGVSIKKGKILKAWNSKGYQRVGLVANGVHRFHFVHRLVAMAFIPNPNSLPHINHIDGNPRNNRPENLEWCTPMTNVTHAREVLKRLGANKKKVFDKSTGRIYESIKEAHVQNRFSHSLGYTVGMLNGSFKNKTALTFL